MKNNTVLQGDCLELMKNLPDKSIDMILCDLPYGTTACKWDTIIPFEPLWQQYKRVIKDRGTIVLFGAEPFSSALRMSNIKQYKYDWVWDKGQGTGFLNSKKQPLRCTENIIVFYATQPTYNPQMRVGFKPYAIKQGRTKTENYGKQSGAESVSDSCRFPLNLLYFHKDKDKFHPTQKPVALCEYLIKTYTNEGETVLDNCAGSGTTAIACINTNRNYILMEKEEKYIETINNRISEHEKNPRR